MLTRMRTATFFLVIFQVLVLMILISFHQTNKHTNYKYDLSEIADSLDSKEFQVPDPNKKMVVKNAKNNICLDSEGVYRQCDEDAYEKFVESDRVEKVADEKVEDTIDEEKELSAEKKNRNVHIDRKVNSVYFHDSYDDTTDTSDTSSNSSFYDKESMREAAPYQSSVMRNVKKIISEKVKNSDKRFVSDKRILFSEVYEQVDFVEDVKLLVIVTTAARKRARRDAIRASWWTQCAQDSTVRCFFFTDDINSPSLKSAKRELLLEKKKYKDIIFQPIDIGLKFGYRILYQMQWAAAHYRFQYLLRVDDDALVCLDHLLHDLPNFPTTNLQWGHLHCETEDIIYIDEGLTIFSHDLVLKFLSQNPLRMRCHVYGDQQVAIWVNDLNLDPEKLYVHDPRIHHTPPASNMKEYFYELDDICKKHIIIHGVYPGEMEDFWELKRKQDYAKYKPKAFSESCDKQASFYWYALGYRFRHQPMYCIQRPVWDTTFMADDDGTFAGREVNPEQL